jgi:hypothetical protein
MKDFWLSCGHHLLDRDDSGGLVVTDEFLKAYLARPELAPPAEACVVERTLHAAVLAEPRRPISAAEIAAIADPDARENWQVMIAFRDHLMRHKTVEAAYSDLIRSGANGTPVLFVNQLTHVILRNALDGCDDAYMLRAGEMFFRPQLLTVHDDALLAADEETIAGVNQQPVSPLVSMLGLPAEAQIDVLGEANASSYWERSDLFDMAIDLTAGKRGLGALGEVLSCWIEHLLGVEVDIEALPEVRDANFSWYVGLDVEATRIGDKLWNGEELDETLLTRVVGLFRLTFRDPSVVTDAVRGEPVYLIMAMGDDRLVRLKPQNLVTGLPIRHLEAVG